MNGRSKRGRRTNVEKELTPVHLSWGSALNSAEDEVQKTSTAEAAEYKIHCKHCRVQIQTTNDEIS